MKYFEMFTGVAGFSKGIEQAYATIRQIQQVDGDDQLCWNAESNGGRPEFATDRGGARRMRDKPICIGFSEIGKTPSAILKFLWPEVRNCGDASKIVCSNLPDFDFLCGGFPCQSWSIAGKRKGFEDARGTLFFEIARILSDKRPRHFLLENVKGLFSVDGGKALAEILRILTELDYRVEVGVFNSKDFGVPQNRERCYFIGHFAGPGGCSRGVLSLGESDGELAFNEDGERHDIAHTVTNGDKQRGSYAIAPSDISYAIDANYHKGCNDLTKGRRTVDNGSERLSRYTQFDVSGKGHNSQQDRVWRIDGAFGTLPASRTENKVNIAVPVRNVDGAFESANGRRMKEDGEARFTVTAQDQHGIFNGQRIRRLTPTECARLQAFPDDHADFGINEKGEKYAISDTGKYQVFGNAVTVSVVEAIITKMLEVGCLE